MKHILLVDDDADLVETTKLRFESEGDYVVSVAYNGEEALRVVQRGVPDVIILDVMMPKMDGLTTLKAMNQMLEKKVPVIVVTGKAVMIKSVFELEGARDFLIKPVDGKRLVERVKEILG